MSKSILFISTLSLATNPRLTKEMELALSNGYKVNVICFEFKNGSKQYNDELINQFSSVNFILLNAQRSLSIKWIFLTFKTYMYQFLLRFISLPEKCVAQAFSKRSDMLIKALKNVNKADLVIGHNPGAIYVTRTAGKRFNCKTGFDIEDFHPGEGHDLFNKNMTLKLMKKILPDMNYISFSSLSIMAACTRSISFQNKQQLLVIRNLFKKNEFNFDAINLIPYTNKIKLVWFSQHIDYGRGLEQIIPVIEKYKDWVQLDLIGQANEHFKNNFLSQKKSLVFHDFKTQKQLHSDLQNYDIGLAIEPGKDINNNLALSNKLLAFFQSGLFIIATKTDGQISFLSEYKDHCSWVEKSLFDFEEILQVCIGKIGQIREQRGERFSRAQSNHWELENKQIQKTWESLLA